MVTKYRRLGSFTWLASSQLFRPSDTVPGLLTVHAPDLHLSVVCPRDNKGHGGVEGSPVYSTIMTLWKKNKWFFYGSFVTINESKLKRHRVVIKNVSDFYSSREESRDYGSLR